MREQLSREEPRLVGDHAELESRRAHRHEAFLHFREQRRARGDQALVVRFKNLHGVVEVRGGAHLIHRALDQRAHAAADERGRGFERHDGKSKPRERLVQRERDLLGRVDERAVEVEDDCADRRDGNRHGNKGR